MADRTIFARALPETVRITETYRYQQIIARNESHVAVGEPKGVLKVTVAYDGQHSFTRQAWLDVREQGVDLLENGKDRQALIGHLAFANTGRTRLEEAMDLRGQFNTVPIQIPLAHPLLDSLVDGNHAWQAVIDYQVEEPSVWPMQVRLEVHDEKSTSRALEASKTHSPSISAQDLAMAIARHLDTPHELTLLVRVHANLPVGSASESVQPVVARVQVRWPRFTSLRAFKVTNEDKSGEEIFHRFDAVRRSLEWGNISMAPVGPVTTNGMRAYLSPTMALTIAVPTDLYVRMKPGWAGNPESEALTGEVQMEIADWLLSGLQVRLLDGTGRMVEKPPLHTSTQLTTAFHLNLDDAFAKRTLSPRLRLHFDRVIPNDLRLMDVRTALADRGFSIKDDKVVLPDSDFSHLLRAERTEGRDKLVLLVVVEGNVDSTRRETEIPGRQKYSSAFQSGELIVHLAGQLSGDSLALIKEMNTLQEALHTRFDSVRANR